MNNIPTYRTQQLSCRSDVILLGSCFYSIQSFYIVCWYFMYRFVLPICRTKGGKKKKNACHICVSFCFGSFHFDFGVRECVWSISISFNVQLNQSINGLWMKIHWINSPAKTDHKLRVVEKRIENKINIKHMQLFFFFFPLVAVVPFCWQKKKKRNVWKFSVFKLTRTKLMWLIRMNKNVSGSQFPVLKQFIVPSFETFGHIIYWTMKTARMDCGLKSALKFCVIVVSPPSFVYVHRSIISNVISSSYLDICAEMKKWQIKIYVSLIVDHGS